MLSECFADEIAIDFPSVDLVVERMRAAFLGECLSEAGDRGDVVRRELLLSSREATGGVVVPVDVPIQTTCLPCGGRGETWDEPCSACSGSGLALHHHRVRLTLPPGVADGSCVRFRIASLHAAAVRVEVRIAVSQ